MHRHDLSICAAMLEALRDPAMIVSSEERLSALNGAMRALAPSARPGDMPSFFLRSPGILDGVRRVLSGGAAENAVWRELVPLERVSQVFVAPLDLADEQCAVGALLDPTDMRRMERMRVDFIANVSHELRTPLASLLGFVETLQGPARDNPVARERFLDIMAEQGRRMSRLIDDLLCLSRVEQPQHLRPSATVEVVSVVRHVIDGLAQLARERRVTLMLDAPGTLNLSGDRDELIRLAENLIGNAIKYGSVSDQDTSVEVSRGISGHEA